MDDLRNRSAREVFEDHLRTAKEWSFEEDIERNFSKECVVLSKHGVHRGHEGLKELARLLREEMPGASKVAWYANNAKAEYPVCILCRRSSASLCGLGPLSALR